MVNEVLFDKFGLKGNSSNYYNHENSFLHCMLDSKKGAYDQQMASY